MKLFNFGSEKKSDLEELKERVDQAEMIREMKETAGYKFLEALLKEQQQAYEIDNATNALNWDDYLKKAGKIFGIQLFFADIEDIVRRGLSAADEIDKLDY